MRFIRGFGQFWYDFIVGDDWKVAAVVVAVLVLGSILLVGNLASGGLLAVVMALALICAFAVVILIDVSGGH